MRRSSLIGVSLLCLALGAFLILRRRKFTGRRREAPPAEILLVSGLHPNEVCAPLTARAVFARLSELGERVALYEIPYRYTLLALIDNPVTAETDYSMLAGGRRLDMDLDRLDDDLRRRYPGALVFEFHNSEDTQPMLGIDPRKPVGDYEVGPIGPGSGRPFEVGTWRNVDGEGRPGKYLVEVPACYAPVDPAVQERRQERLAQLREAGFDFDPQWSHYLESGADLEASRGKGYLDDGLARKIADWIVKCREAVHPVSRLS